MQDDCQLHPDAFYGRERPRARETGSKNSEKEKKNDAAKARRRCLQIIFDARQLHSKVVWGECKKFSLVVYI